MISCELSLQPHRVRRTLRGHMTLCSSLSFTLPLPPLSPSSLTRAPSLDAARQRQVFLSEKAVCLSSALKTQSHPHAPPQTPASSTSSTNWHPDPFSPPALHAPVLVLPAMVLLAKSRGRCLFCQDPGVIEIVLASAPVEG